MLKARLATVIGTRAFLRVYWDGCTNCLGKGNSGFHNAEVLLGSTPTSDDWKFMGEPSDYKNDPRWPTKCDHCGSIAPSEATHQVFRKRLYDTQSGDLEPGCLYWADWYNNDIGGCVFHDTGCDGKHLYAICPNGAQWDIDGRASNCTMPNDRIHRCWVRHGSPPNVTVDKSGNTCAAGGGSIQAGDYHGFLKMGSFT